MTAVERNRPRVQRRVVVTGLGAISSLGNGADTLWASLLAGKSGIRTAENLDPAIISSTIRGDVDDADVPNRFLDAKTLRNTSRFARMGIEAAGEALIDAGLVDTETLEPSPALTSAGAVIGTCGAGVHDDFLNAWESYKGRGVRGVPIHLHVSFPHNLAGYGIQARFGMGGPSLTLTTACATGAQAIGEAFEEVRDGRAPVMIGGATESTHHPMYAAGFAVMRALVSDRNDDPAAASRPFDATRAGFVLGEGAAMLVLEDLEHALARGAHIYAEVLGFATSNDAYHPIAPLPDGTGGARAMTDALRDAGVEPAEVDHINAHAASTPAGDLAESNAIRLVYGERADQIPVTSVKGALGHCMGASGALETIAAVRSIDQQVIPPTLNYLHPDDAIGLDIVHGAPRAAEIDVVAKHSFGLGGQNACLILGRFDPDEAAR
ncbi:MAG: beta-ketoacyl-[acyl-carrier-protein] synthase family protein [Thermomicrobiales bacterium]|nr:beta-ketoacyl-[acyl-carrier-protein] synthase family protein [Thermomicrobiales bacterium]